MKISTARVETFSDGVIAIIITIMVLALKLPDINKDNTPVKFTIISVTWLLILLLMLSAGNSTDGCQSIAACFLCTLWFGDADDYPFVCYHENVYYQKRTGA